jgi:hypothetical protein
VLEPLKKLLEVFCYLLLLSPTTSLDTVWKSLEALVSRLKIKQYKDTVCNLLYGHFISMIPMLGCQ